MGQRVVSDIGHHQPTGAASVVSLVCWFFWSLMSLSRKLTSVSNAVWESFFWLSGLRAQHWVKLVLSCGSEIKVKATPKRKQTKCHSLHYFQKTRSVSICTNANPMLSKYRNLLKSNVFFNTLFALSIERVEQWWPGSLFSNRDYNKTVSIYLSCLKRLQLIKALSFLYVYLFLHIP